MNIFDISNYSNKAKTYFFLSLSLAILNCIVFLLTPLVVGHDETYQLQAAGRFAKGDGLTIRKNIVSESDGLSMQPEFITHWPAGYSFFIGSFLKISVPLVIAVKLTVSICYLLGCFCFLVIGWYLLKDAWLLWLMFLFPVIWRESLFLRTDCMLWAITPIFVLLFWKGILRAQHYKKQLQFYLLIASILTGLVYWVRYTGIILFASGILFVLYVGIKQEISWKNILGFILPGGIIIISIHGFNYILSGEIGYIQDVVKRQFHWAELWEGWLSLEPFNALFFTPAISMSLKRFIVAVKGPVCFDNTFFWVIMFIIDLCFMVILIKYLKKKSVVIHQKLIVIIGLFLLAVEVVLLSYFSLMEGYVPGLALKVQRYYWPVYGIFFPAGLHIIYCTVPVFKKINTYLLKHWKIFVFSLYLLIVVVNVCLLCKVILRDGLRPLKYSYGILGADEREEVYNLISNRGDSDRVIIVSQSMIDLLIEDKYDVFGYIPPLDAFVELSWVYLIYSKDLTPYGGVVEVTSWVSEINRLRKKYGFKYKEFSQTAVCYGKLEK